MTAPKASSPEDQRIIQQKGAVSRREPRATGPVEFFTRSRTIGTTSINRANANAASKSQKPHFTSRQSCGGYRVKKLGGSPSSRPRRRPAVALLLPRCCPAAPPPRCFSCCFTTAYLSSFFPIPSSSSKALQAPQRTRKRNSTNSTNTTYPTPPEVPPRSPHTAFRLRAKG